MATKTRNTVTSIPFSGEIYSNVYNNPTIVGTDGVFDYTLQLYLDKINKKLLSTRIRKLTIKDIGYLSNIATGTDSFNSEVDSEGNLVSTIDNVQGGIFYVYLESNPDTIYGILFSTGGALGNLAQLMLMTGAESISDPTRYLVPEYDNSPLKYYTRHTYVNDDDKVVWSPWEEVKSKETDDSPSIYYIRSKKDVLLLDGPITWANGKEVYKEISQDKLKELETLVSDAITNKVIPNLYLQDQYEKTYKAIGIDFEENYIYFYNPYTLTNIELEVRSAPDGYVYDILILEDVIKDIRYDIDRLETYLVEFSNSDLDETTNTGFRSYTFNVLSSYTLKLDTTTLKNLYNRNLDTIDLKYVTSNDSYDRVYHCTSRYRFTLNGVKYLSYTFDDFSEDNFDTKEQKFATLYISNEGKAFIIVYSRVFSIYINISETSDGSIDVSIPNNDYSLVLKQIMTNLVSSDTTNTNNIFLLAEWWKPSDDEEANRMSLPCISAVGDDENARGKLWFNFLNRGFIVLEIGYSSKDKNYLITSLTFEKTQSSSNSSIDTFKLTTYYNSKTQQYEIDNELVSAEGSTNSISYLKEKLEKSIYDTNITLDIIDKDEDSSDYGDYISLKCSRIEATANAFDMFFVLDFGDYFIVSVYQNNKKETSCKISHINADAKQFSDIKLYFKELKQATIDTAYNAISVTTTTDKSYYYKGYGFNSVSITGKVTGTTASNINTLAISGNASKSVGEATSVSTTVNIPNTATTTYKFTTTVSFKGDFEGKANKTNTKNIAPTGPIYYGSVTFDQDFNATNFIKAAIADGLDNHLYSSTKPVNTISKVSFTIAGTKNANNIWFLVPKANNANLTALYSLGTVPFDIYNTKINSLDEKLNSVTEDYLLYVSQNKYSDNLSFTFN